MIAEPVVVIDAASAAVVPDMNTLRVDQLHRSITDSGMMNAVTDLEAGRSVNCWLAACWTFRHFDGPSTVMAG